MEKLNALGLELKELKIELLNDKHPKVIKRALALSAEELIKKDIIDADLHLVLTDEKTDTNIFEKELLENKACLKTKEEMLIEFDKIREIWDTLLSKEGVQLESKSLVEKDQLSFARTFRLDKSWVSKYFGQPNEEIDKLMVRNGFVEKFAVLRLSTILENFVDSEMYKEREEVAVKATRVFYDVEEGYYGIHLMFYVGIEKAESEEIQEDISTFIKEIVGLANEYVEKRLMI